MKLSRLTSLPLRTKLTAAIAIPVSGLLVLSAVQVQNLTSVVSSADQQLEIVESSVIVADVAAAVRTERDVQLTVVGNSSFGQANEQTTSSDTFFAGVREKTDLAIEEALANTSLSSEDRTDIERVQVRLAEARSLVGNDLGAVKDDLVVEMTTGGSSLDAGSTMSALATFDEIVVETFRLIDIDPGADLDSQTALDLTTLQLSTAFDESIRLEALAYLEIALLEQDQQPESLVLAARQRGSEAAQLEALVIELGNTEFNAAFASFLDGPRYQDFVTLRESVATQSAGEIEVSQTTVLNALLAMTNSLNDVKGEVVDAVQSRATDNKADAERQLMIGGIALAALVALIAALTVVLFRSIRGPLLTLTERSRSISDVELPHVVQLLREEGVNADVPEIVPIESDTTDEIGELVAAFNDMHRTAVDLASEQAASRRTVADMFVNLGRRNQRLLMRILDYLDGLEATEKDPETLERLFKIDHLATRMRRNAESLIVLAGAREARVFDGPVAVAEVVRSALGEVEGYERVDLDVRTDKLIDGSAVADAAHLLAELIENSLSFSPPTSRVVVSAAESSKGFVVAVADSGIGMTPDAMIEANATITRAMTLEETPSNDLGHHVVGRLAGRHGIQVELLDGITDGLVAKVMVPSSLISDSTPEDEDLASLFSAADKPTDGDSVSDDVAARDSAAVDSLELTVVPDLDLVDRERVEASSLPEVAAEAPHIADTHVAAADIEVAAEWHDPAPAPTKPMSVAEASRIARSERAAVAEEAAVPASDETPSVLETTSGFALARRRRHEDETDSSYETALGDEAPLARRRDDASSTGSSNPLGVTRSPGTNLPSGVKPTMDVPSADSDADGRDPVLVSAGSAADDVVDADNTDAGSRFAASLASFQSGIQRATSPNDETEESS